MPSIQDLLKQAEKRWGVTVPTPEERKKQAARREKLWLEAKADVVTKNPKQWFEQVLEDNINAGLQQIKTVSDLKYYHFLIENEDEFVLDRIPLFHEKFSMTVKINKINEARSCVLLYNRFSGEIYRYPDWDSYKQLIEEEKKEAKKDKKPQIET